MKKNDIKNIDKEEEVCIWSRRNIYNEDDIYIYKTKYKKDEMKYKKGDMYINKKSKYKEI